MLQQTQVVTVIPYYARFLSRFPTVHALADAPLDDVLRLWAGLGYYARARNLHAAARMVARDRGGAFPDTVDGLLELPGVGCYTAAAVASIAFGRRAAVLDGNVARVLARLFAIRKPVKSAQTQRRLWNLADALMPTRSCGDFNQAMMELGATVCTPAAPRCDACPLAAACLARQRGLTAQLPVVARRSAPQLVEFVVAAIEADGCLLFERRAARGLWGGLWQLPTTERNDGEPTWHVAAALTARHDLRRVHVSRRPTATVERTLSHRHARFIIHRCRASRSAPQVPADASRIRWLAPERIRDIPLSAAMMSVLAAL